MNRLLFTLPVALSSCGDVNGLSDTTDCSSATDTWSNDGQGVSRSRVRLPAGHRFASPMT